VHLLFEQALPDFVFQRLNLPAQRRLREEDILRGAADVARFSHRHEVTQLPESHAGQHNHEAGPGQLLSIGWLCKLPPPCRHENDNNRVDHSPGR
jgi:hypothetical protein